MVGPIDLFSGNHEVDNIEDALSNSLNFPIDFQIRAVDGITSTPPNIKYDVERDFNISLMTSDTGTNGVQNAVTPIPGKFNILKVLMQKNFHGAGLNMIFRPSYGNNRRNNVLEYNVTEEVTQFVKDIGKVPNRGLGRQRDAIVKAVPYTQMIKDLFNEETGKLDHPEPPGIHFETGMFIRHPESEVRPGVQYGTISRLASIPHGTTINCQGREPDMDNPIPGTPVILPISILPFPMMQPYDLVTFDDFFPQMRFERKMNLRIPQEVKKDGVLNPKIMANPNLFLIEYNNSSDKKRVINHYHLRVSSDPKISGIPGGGTSNIAFLAGSGIHDGTLQNPGPNADGVVVTCDYWISTVEYDVLLPEGDYSAKGVYRTLDCEARKEEKAAGKVLVAPRFTVYLKEKIGPNTIAKYTATQIQYSQNVTLNFDEMGWPHVSVATLGEARVDTTKITTLPVDD